MLRPYGCLLPKSLFLHRRRALPVADVDDDPFRAFELVFEVRRAEIHRAGFDRAAGFHFLELLLVVRR